MFEMVGDLSSFIFLGIACFVASFVDAIAGGGGLISVPAFLASGLPAHVALGVNKFSCCSGTVASSIRFARSGKVNWDLVKRLAPFSFLGAILGVRTVVLIDSKYLYPLVIALLIILLIYTLCNKKMGEKNEFLGFDGKSIKKGICMAVALGFYDGFFGPGTGSLLIFGLIKIFKFDFTNASGNTKILNLSSNLSSVMTFIFLGKVNYLYGIIMAVIMVIGATLGAKTAVTRGTKFIKPFFLVMTTIVLAKMIAESMFGINVGLLLKNVMSIFI